MNLFADKERRMIGSIRHGNHKAMKEAYDCYAGYLLSVIRRYVPDKESSEDILQESFIRIFSKIELFEYKGKGSFRAWMSRIAANEALKHLRSLRKEPLYATEDKIPEVRDGDQDEPTESAVDKVPAAVIQEMIGKLPEGYRSVFNLYVFEEMSHKEIAEELGISEATSASQLHRAKARLAKMIREYESGLDR